MKFILSTLLLGFSMLVSAQNSIRGTVSDINGPIAEALISFPELHQEVLTDANGNYALTNLPSGNFTIVVSHPKWDTYSTTITLQKEVVQDFILEEQHTHHIDEIVLSTVFNKVQSQNVMKVEHSSIKALQQKGATTLMEGLATIPGVSNYSTGVSIGKPVIRGLSGNRVLVYSQGVRLENQQFGEEHGLGLNDSGIESVEVIKGPASLLYGSDALGGVLYFNPEKFAKNNSYQADFSQKYFSNTMGSSTSFGLKSSSNNWKFLARGGYNSHADYKVADGTRITNTRFEEADAKIGIGYANSKFSSTFRYNLNNLNLGLPESVGEQTTKRNPDYPRQGVLGQIMSLHNTFFLRNSKLEADFGYISNKRKEFEDAPVALLDMNLQTFNYDLKYFFPKFGKLETIVGVQGMHQTNKNNGEELLIPNATTKDLGGLVTANYQWNKNSIQAGVRFDSRDVVTETNGTVGEEGYFQAIDKQFNSFNASLGYKTNITSKIEMRFNLATGFRAPNLAELTSNGVHEGSNRYEIGNANLKKEQNIQADWNLEYGNEHFEVFVNGFYNHIDNYIFISPTGNVIDGNNVYEYVQSNAKLFGGEAGIHIHPHPIDWLHVTSSFESVTAQKDNGDNLPLIPANKWNTAFRANFNLGKTITDAYFTTSVETTLAQNNISEFETKTLDYTLLNLALGGTIRLGNFKMDTNLNANNLLNRNYVSHLSRLKPDGISNIGRNIVLGVAFNL